MYGLKPVPFIQGRAMKPVSSSASTRAVPLLQIPALADVDRRQEGIALVNGCRDALLQHSLGFENELDRVARCAVPALVRSHVMRLGLYLRPSIGHGHGKSAYAHYRQIDHIVAHISNLV